MARTDDPIIETVENATAVCIGGKFTLDELRLAIRRLDRRYHLDPDELESFLVNLAAIEAALESNRQTLIGLRNGKD